MFGLPDLLDRLTKEVTPHGTVSYTYDNADRRETMTVSGQNAVNYTFDNANRLTQISQSGTGTVGFGYDNADRRTLLTLPNGATAGVCLRQRRSWRLPRDLDHLQGRQHDHRKSDL